MSHRAAPQGRHGVRRPVAANAPQQHPTPENYLELAYMGEVPAELSAEAPLRAFISGKRLASRVDRTKFRFPVGG
jgi:hypothetical protein